MGGTRWRSNSESGPSRLNSDLSVNRNALYHQAQQTIPIDLPEGFIESSMWVGTGTRLQVRRLPAGNDQQAIIQSKYEINCENIAVWERDIDEEPITFEGIKSEYFELKGSIHSLYQDALYG